MWSKIWKIALAIIIAVCIVAVIFGINTSKSNGNSTADEKSISENYEEPEKDENDENNTTQPTGRISAGLEDNENEEENDEDTDENTDFDNISWAEVTYQREIENNQSGSIAGNNSESASAQSDSRETELSPSVSDHTNNITDYIQESSENGGVSSTNGRENAVTSYSSGDESLLDASKQKENDSKESGSGSASTGTTEIVTTATVKEENETDDTSANDTANTNTDKNNSVNTLSGESSDSQSPSAEKSTSTNSSSQAESKTGATTATGTSTNASAQTNSKTTEQTKSENKNTESAVETETQHVHSLEKIDSVDATCTTYGHITYWRCKGCDKYFNDANGENEIQYSDIVIRSLGHNTKHVEMSEPTCAKTGNTEYWYCTACGSYFSDDEAVNEIPAADTILSATGHTTVHIEAKEATEEENGHTEYWYCTSCRTYFADENCQTEMARNKTIIPAYGHSPVKIDAVEATCTTDGNTEYWRCTTCGKYFADEDCTNEISFNDTIAAAFGHTVKKKEATSSTCTEEGNIEYWYCETCGMCFSNEEGTVELPYEETLIPTLDHTPIKVAAKEATEDDNGNIEHWRCTVCGKYFTDEACTKELSYKETIIPAYGHVIEHTDAVEATCTEGGNTEYWHCTVCGKYFSDEDYIYEISFEDTIVKALGHSTIEVEAKDPSCNETGNINYWYCYRCHKYFSDENCINEISFEDTVIDMLEHSPIKVGAKEATEDDNGSIECWQCELCGKYFTDESCSEEISYKDTVIPAYGHSVTKIEAKDATCTKNGNTEYWYCVICEKCFRDEGCIYEISYEDSIIEATGHKTVEIKAKEPTCAEDGNINCWYCYKCHAYFADEDCSNEIAYNDTIIETIEHSATRVEAKEATCRENGNLEYWYCDSCGKCFLDESCSNEVEYSKVVTEPNGYTMIYIEAENSTCTEDGNKAYYICENCGGCFGDKFHITELSEEDIIIPASHNIYLVEAKDPTDDADGNTEYWYCITCGSCFSGENYEDEISYEDTIVHRWQPVYKTVHHDEIGHYETIYVKSEYIYGYVCKSCGYTTTDLNEMSHHILYDHSGNSSYKSGYGWTEAYSYKEWVVDAEEYDEEVVDYYECQCGAMYYPTDTMRISAAEIYEQISSKFENIVTNINKLAELSKQCF